MKVQGIFKVLVIMVACIVLGAMVLNIFLPNVVTQIATAAEDAVFKGTGMSFDFNGDNRAGGSNSNNTYNDNSNGGNFEDEIAADVEGFS